MKCFTSFLLAAVLTYGGSQRASMSVSVTVRPGVKIDILSSTEARVQVVLYPNTQALAWLTAGTCTSPQEAQAIIGSGIHRVTFPEQDTTGKTLCVASTDGAVRGQTPMRTQ